MMTPPFQVALKKVESKVNVFALKLKEKAFSKWGIDETDRSDSKVAFKGIFEGRGYKNAPIWGPAGLLMISYL